MLAATVIGVSGAWGMFLAPSLGRFTLALTVFYFSWLVIVPLSSYVRRVQGEWTFTRAITTVHAGYHLGSIIGPGLGGQIASVSGIQPVIGVAAGVFLISPIALAMLPSAPGKPDPTAIPLREIRANTPFLRLLPLLLFGMLSLFLNWPLTPNYLQNVRQVSLQQIGFFGSFNAIGGLLFSLTLGRLPPFGAFLLAQGSVLTASLLLWLGGGIPWYALGYFFAAGYRLAHTLALPLSRPMLSDNEIGVAYGVLYAVTGVAALAAAPIAGVLYEVRAFLPYPTSIVLIGISILAFVYFMPRLKETSLLNQSQIGEGLR